jgi:undecaprenyl-diphosphatase
MKEFGPVLAAILGIVEGLTEFLPVSSTGHLILVGYLLEFTGELASSVEISIQFGAILAIIAYERGRIASLFREAAREQSELVRLMVSARSIGAGMKTRRAVLSESAATHRHLWFLLGLLIAFVPAGVAGLAFHKWIETHLFSPLAVAAALIVGGVIIMWAERRRHSIAITRLEQVDVYRAFLVGLAQCVSLFPGISRSGATIIGGLLVGMDRKVATEYSFFLALPTLLAATLYKLLKSRELLTADDLGALAVGLVVAFAVAWAVIAGFLAYVKRHSLNVFAYYRIVLGFIVLLLFH